MRRFWPDVDQNRFRAYGGAEWKLIGGYLPRDTGRRTTALCFVWATATWRLQTNCLSDIRRGSGTASLAGAAESGWHGHGEHVSPMSD